MKWGLAILFVVAFPLTASAEPGAGPGVETPANAISLEMIGLVTRGLSGQFERRITPRLSVAASGGVRSRGAGDYDSLTLSTGAELRWWILRRAPWTGFRAPAMVGLYLGARVDVARTATRDRVDDESIGTMVAIAEDFSVGYRFAFGKRVEVTPSAGAGMRHELDTSGRLPPWTRASLSFGLTVGVLF